MGQCAFVTFVISKLVQGKLEILNTKRRKTPTQKQK